MPNSRFSNNGNGKPRGRLQLFCRHRFNSSGTDGKAATSRSALSRSLKHERSPQSRWARWARQLARRFGLLTRNDRAPEMILTRRLELSQVFNQRWIGAFSLFPKLNLSILHLLRQAAGLPSRRFVQVPPGSRFSSEVSIKNVVQAGGFRNGRDGHSGEGASHYFAREVVKSNGEPRTYVSLHKFPTAATSAVATQRDFAELLSRPQGDAYRSKMLDHTPLERIFFRFSDRALISSVRQLAADTQAHYCTITERVIARAQRLEGAARGSLIPASPINMVLRQQTALAANPTIAGAFEQPAGWPQAQPAPLNVNDLADQVIREIDNRTTAWRERLGRT